MIVSGVQTTESVASAGTFSCPRCQALQAYRRLVHKRWFTLYFLPVLPLGRLGEQVECQGCFARFSPEELTGRESGEPVTAVLVDEQGAPGRTSAPLRQAPPKNSPLAIASLVLGLVSPAFFCACGLSVLTSLGAIIAGHVALVNIKRSTGRLAGRGMAVSGLVLGYLLLVVSIGWWGTFYQGLQRGRQMAQQRSRSLQTSEDRLQSAEMSVLTHSREGVASGNSPEAKQLAGEYARTLKVMRDAMFTEDRDRVVSLSQGHFLVHCELHPGRCAFIVHVPSYRDFDEDAKELLEISAWQLAQQTVEGTLNAGDRLAVGLRGALLYGAVLVGEVGLDESDPNHFTPAERPALLAFFPDEDDDVESLLAELPEPGAQPADGAAPEPPAGEEPSEFRPGAGPSDSPSGAVPPALERDPELAPPTATSDAGSDSSPAAPTNARPAALDSPSRLRAKKPPAAAEIGPLAQVVQQFPDMGWTVQSLAFAPNGRYLAAGKLDSTLLLLDAETGQRLQSETMRDELGQVQCVAFSSDGRKLFAGGYRGSIHAWNVDDAGRLQPVGPLRGHARPVTTLATSAAGLVLSGSAAGELIWQAYDEPSQDVRTLAAFERAVLAVHLPESPAEAWATDGRRLVQFDSGEAKIVKIYELGRGAAHAAAFSSDGAQLAVTLGYDISLWDTQTGAPIMTLSAGHEIQWSVAFLPDGGGLVSGGRGKATLWRLSDGKPFAAVDLGGVQYIKPLAVSSDGKLLAAIPSSAGQTLTIARVPDSP